MSKCKHKWKLVYEGDNIQIVEKKSNYAMFLKGKWKVCECAKCGFKDILDIRKNK